MRRGIFSCTAAFPSSASPAPGRGRATASVQRVTRSARLRRAAKRRCAATPHGGVGLFSNGFLPAQHQASIVKADEAEAVANIRPRQPHDMQRRQLDFIGAMDRRFVSTAQHDMHVEAAISNYEMAWRMQSAVPRPLRHLRRNRGDEETLRPRRSRAEKSRLRPPVLARPATRRTWRALHRTQHAGLQPRRRKRGQSLGSSQRAQGRSWQDGQPDRPAHRPRSSRTCAHAGCSTARCSSGPVSLAALRLRKANERSRSQSVWIHGLDGWRRRQRRAHLRIDR
jgi:hypothetical protein